MSLGPRDSDVSQEERGGYRYRRAPSENLRRHLARGLAFLLAPREVSGIRLDVHLREDDDLHVYCGLTRLLDLAVRADTVTVRAHETFSSQACAAGLFRRWDIGDAELPAALGRYLEAVLVPGRHVKREGSVQARWASVREPWTPFDCEAVLGYRSRADQGTGRSSPAVNAARAEVAALTSAEGWAPLPKGKVGAELDLLAVDPEGRFVLLELKDATSAASASLFYAPLQLLQYVHEWALAFEAVKGQLARLMDARRGLGLSPSDMSGLTAGLRPVIGFGEDGRTPEVRRRFSAVLAIANRHLPPIAMPIEVWALENEERVRLA